MPVPYFHVVFTLPAPVGAVAFQNKAAVYAILFAAAAEAMMTLAANPRRLVGAQIGVVMILHTWGQALTHHPHVHCVVPGGGLSPERNTLDCRAAELGFHQLSRPLAKLFRRLFLERLQESHLRRRRPELFRRTLSISPIPRASAPSSRTCAASTGSSMQKKPFGGTAQALAYLGRYTHRVAIANSRLAAVEDDHVAFAWRGLSPERRLQDHEARPRRVHPSLSPAHPARRLPPHPPLRLAWPMAVAPQSSPCVGPLFSNGSSAPRPRLTRLRRLKQTSTLPRAPECGGVMRIVATRFCALQIEALQTVRHPGAIRHEGR